ncbi:MAG: hypothetical protein P4L03_00495 [Terracidiphilus sp.]|nr:hypothetical protein [Terracidiphilus sp.]
MARAKRIDKSLIIPCALTEEARSRIEAYAKALVAAAPSIGEHHLSERDFWRSRIFFSAVEKIRGTQSASVAKKKAFIDSALQELRTSHVIGDFAFTGAGDRHDYQVVMPDGHVCIIEAKGCLDGNNSTVYTRPPNADEFIIWSLCQNPGADPRHNVWSGIHTRLGGKIISEKEAVDALIVWDALCGSERPCPKVVAKRGKDLQGRLFPPPCIYLFPRTIPDPRNNPHPAVWKLDEVRFAKSLLEHFGGDERDVAEVHIEVRMNQANVERKTTLKRQGSILAESGWTELKRATR